MLSSPQPSLTVEFPPAFEFLFRPSRYKCAYGGRGSAKSWSFARALILAAYARPVRVLCAREIQASIADSVYRLLIDQIQLLGLGSFFAIQQQTIISHVGAQFIFAGLWRNITKIKSMEGLTHVWIEEAENISEDSWQKLIPTIRRPASEIWVTFNPNAETDPTYKRFVIAPPPAEVAAVKFVSWRDNPHLTAELALERDYLARVDVDAYQHVWEGACRTASDAQIFKGKYCVEAFEPGKDWKGPYFGADWGFSQDPTTLVKCWINGLKLYIEHEVYKIGCDIDKTPALFDLVPGSHKQAIRADCARPETISYLQRHGYGNVIGVEKWPGSVEDGIAHLRSYEQVVIHPRCTHAAQEARLYSYKVDKLSNDVLPEIVDAHNHIWDAVRYALQPLIRNVNTGFLTFMQQEVEKMNERKRREEKQ